MVKSMMVLLVVPPMLIGLSFFNSLKISFSSAGFFGFIDSHAEMPLSSLFYLLNVTTTG